MVGIYKITNPLGEVYIGQSWDIKRRWRAYNNPKGKHSVFVSVAVHGWKSHKFDVLTELPKDVTQGILNEYEKIYIEQFRDCGISIMNKKTGGSKGNRYSEESRGKMSKARIGMKLSNETKSKMSEMRKGKSYTLGRKQTEEEKEKRRQSCLRTFKMQKELGLSRYKEKKIVSEQHRENLSTAATKAWEKRKNK